jgi:hypothetical protein
MITLQGILEILRCNIIESVEDGTIYPPEEMRRQREFITEAKLAILEVVKGCVNSQSITEKVLNRSEHPQVAYGIGYKQCRDDINSKIGKEMGE